MGFGVVRLVGGVRGLGRAGMPRWRGGFGVAAMKDGKEECWMVEMRWKLVSGRQGEVAGGGVKSYLTLVGGSTNQGLCKRLALSVWAMWVCLWRWLLPVRGCA